MHELASANILVVTQKKEWGEILSGFETRNRYVVRSELGNEIYYAAEESGSLLARWFLRALRPFTIVVMRTDGSPVLYLKRPFRFFFHELNVQDAQGRLLGNVKWEFSLLRRLFRVSDAAGKEIGRLYGPVFHPWTFEIRENERTVGKISKKWTGLLKEGFTDADNFGIQMPPNKSVEAKSVLLGSVFLIDFVYFENTGR